MPSSPTQPSPPPSVPIMPAPPRRPPARRPPPPSPASEHHTPPLKKARRPACSPASLSATPPSSPPSRRRAPALERLPRWLFYPVRTFVSPRTALPLPHRVAGRGKPFYDWDAWALSLLSARLWRRRGPWERLVRACREARPRVLDSPPDVKAALVRIVVAEVVSLLVARSGDALTPEDRNWITSVASRQKGRDPRKPTLMLLFDLAFPIFDLAALARSRSFSSVAPLPPIPPQLVDTQSDADSPADHQQQQPRLNATVYQHLRELVSTASANTTPSPLPHHPHDSSTPPSDNPHADPVVMGVLSLISATELTKQSTDPTSLDAVHVVVATLERFLSDMKAPRWNDTYTSHARQTNASIDQLARILARQLPLRLSPTLPPSLTPTPSPSPPLSPLSTPTSASNTKQPIVSFPHWFRYALGEAQWPAWAEVANEFSYIARSTVASDSTPHELLAKYTAAYLLHDATADQPAELDFNNLSDAKLDALSQSVLGFSKANELSMFVRLVIDVALGFEEFYTLFAETYSNPSAVGPEMHWIVTAFEGLVRVLSMLRDTLLSDGTTREQEMIAWSVRSVNFANFYSEIASLDGQMVHDLHRAVRISFAEASWPQNNRTYRSTIAVPVHRSQSAEGSEVSSGSSPEQSSTPVRPSREPPVAPAPTTDARGQSITAGASPHPQNGLQHWILALDLRDPVNLALAIVQWDPRRAIALLDEAVGISPTVLRRITDGKEALPLWDLRRVRIGRMLSKRFEMNPTRITLSLERLQPIFDEMGFHEGGNFSIGTKALLEEEVQAGNVCAQTALGLLYCGEGEYWEIARRWARVEKSTDVGASLLYVAAGAGDPYACTGLSHVLATKRGVKDGSLFREIHFEQVVALFKTAVHTQNDKAVLNVGVLWQHGVEGLMEANSSAATDSFLMALQGAYAHEARCVSASHLSGCFADGTRKEISALLCKLSANTAPEKSVASSPLRVDQFSGYP